MRLLSPLRAAACCRTVVTTSATLQVQRAADQPVAAGAAATERCRARGTMRGGLAEREKQTQKREREREKKKKKKKKKEERRRGNSNSLSQRGRLIASLRPKDSLLLVGPP